MSADVNDSPVKAVRWVGRSVVLDIEGDVDLGRSTRFQQAVLVVLEQKPDCMIINLAGVEYMDSSGVASLVKLLSRVRRLGLSLKLVQMRERVRSVFEITRLNTVFEIFDTEEEALSGQ